MTCEAGGKTTMGRGRTSLSGALTIASTLMFAAAAIGADDAPVHPAAAELAADTRVELAANAPAQLVADAPADLAANAPAQLAATVPAEPSPSSTAPAAEASPTSTAPAAELSSTVPAPAQPPATLPAGDAQPASALPTTTVPADVRRRAQKAAVGSGARRLYRFAPGDCAPAERPPGSPARRSQNASP